MEYIQRLVDMGLKVRYVSIDDQYPDSVFLEDIAIIVDDKALVTNPGHPTRRNEVAAVQDCLQGLQRLKIAKMQYPATMDGGDVLFTGQEFFVGISTRTNMEGYHKLCEEFPQYPCHTIKISGTLHLKSVVSNGPYGTIFIGSSDIAASIKEQMQARSTQEYQFLDLPDDPAANVISVANSLLIRRDYPQSVKVIEDYLDGADVKVFSLDGSELEKVDGALTCCSIIFR